MALILTDSAELEQWHITCGNSKHWCRSVARLYHYFIHHQIREGRALLSVCPQTHHTRLLALCPGQPVWASGRKVKPIWILLKQETVSGSGIRWTICKSATRCRQITICQHTTTQFFTGQMHFLPPNQQRQSTEGTTAAQKQHLSEQVTLRGSRLLTDVVDVAATLDILGYSEPAPDCGCCDFDFFSASCSDNAIAVSISRHKVNITLHHLPLRHTQQSRRDQTERNVLLSCRIQQYVTVSLINSIVLHQPSD